jgi:hypothetical protein
MAWQTDRKIEDRKMGGDSIGLSGFSCLSFSCHSLVGGFALLLATASPLWSAEPAALTDGEKALREKWQGVYQEIARSLEMREGETKLDLYDQPLLFYTNPVRTNDQHGSMFLWTHEGRPAVIGSIWSALNRNDASLRHITHEFHSLSERPDVQAARGGPGLSKSQTQWSAGEPGIAWQALVGSPAPASSRAGRLSQMRAAARRLSASITAEEAGDLRLMPQPLYRYPEKTSGAVDGALFAFALATDPELIVVIEQQENTAQSAMRVAFARFGNLAMSVKDGERELWSCDRGTPGKSEGKYYLRWRIEERRADLSP